eukprot:5905067-Amphidinium_carterae.2
MQRALHHRTRKPIEMKNLTVGSQVDIWYEPTNKETGSWRGPATVASIQESEGNVTVRYQGRTLDRRAQEVREHIVYHIFYAAPHQETWEALRQRIDLVDKHILVGHILVDAGWQLTAATSGLQGSTLYALLSRVASMLGFSDTYAARVSRGQTSTAPLPEYEQCEVWCWHPNDTFVRLQLWLDAPQTSEQKTFLFANPHLGTDGRRSGLASCSGLTMVARDNSISIKENGTDADSDSDTTTTTTTDSDSDATTTTTTTDNNEHLHGTASSNASDPNIQNNNLKEPLSLAGTSTTSQ